MVSESWNVDKISMDQDDQAKGLKTCTNILKMLQCASSGKMMFHPHDSSIFFAEIALTFSLFYF